MNSPDDTGTYELSSGFTVKVKTLGPYALDPLSDRFRDPGPFTFQVKLLAGDEVTWVYEPPEARPDPDSDREDYELYRNWEMYQRRRGEVAAAFERARRDFVMTNCFEIVDGPVSVEDNGWVERNTSTMPAPESYSERLLLFLKTQVITTLMEWELLAQAAIAPEVDMEGIYRAFRSFRRDLGRGGDGRRVGDVAEVEGETLDTAMGGGMRG